MSQRPTKGQEGTISIPGHFLDGIKVSFEKSNGGSVAVKLLESRGAVWREGDFVTIAPEEWADMKEGPTQINEMSVLRKTSFEKETGKRK
jgi:hypothetical protein